MARLILFLMLFGALAFAFSAAVAAWRTLTPPAPARALVPAVREDGMPPAIRNAAYVLLLLLLAGLTSGWLGPT